MAELFASVSIHDPAFQTAAWLIAISIAIVALLILTNNTKTRQIQSRLQSLHAEPETSEAADKAQLPLLVRIAQASLERRAQKTSKKKEALSEKMWRAGFYSDTASAWWIVWRVALVPIGATGGALISMAYTLETLGLQQSAAIGVLGGSLAGLLGPSIYLQNKTDKRKAALRKAWPDLLDLLSLTIGAGLTLETALLRIRTLLQYKSPDLARELTELVAELMYFGERTRALRNLSARCNLTEVDEMVTAIVQSERKGLPLASLMMTMAREQRRKRQVEIEKKAASLPAKLTVPMILFFLPALLVVILAPVAFRLGEVF